MDRVAIIGNTSSHLSTLLIEILRSDRWLTGPGFLWQGEDTWPKFPEGLKDLEDDDPEVRREAQVNATSAEEAPGLDELTILIVERREEGCGVVAEVQVLAFGKSTPKARQRSGTDTPDRLHHPRRD
ncbi:predicted protein [Nematostella vectensis]|uniref:Uncharacterized protein n=1 Tax=Nematostella vectensis TaxID=45351 RepID=A7T2L3_NEMVE|nr:predicted protein [Nematostella vectensis]|eukprot:XP_001621902.1 hypothetical protein NEMVEDRAFT_v1g221438 [Nematostella vectensis]